MNTTFFRILKKAAGAVLLLSIMTCMCGCEKLSKNNEASATIFAMDTYMAFEAYGDHAEEAVADASEEIRRLENLFSTNIESSDVAKINAAGGGDVSDETAELVEASLDFYEKTDGAYDITVYPIVRAWGFTTGSYRVPEDTEIRLLLPLVGSHKMHLERHRISFDKKGMMIDLGTIAKGYTSQRLALLFQSKGIESALINLGGNVQAVGYKPDGTPWRVAIQKPDKDAPDTDYIGILSCHDCAVTTAGGYERYFEEGGKIYRHIFDPKTGYPVENDLKSVSVVAKDGITADGYDTALYVMGKEGAIDFWKAHADLFDIILVDGSDTIYISEPIAKDFSTDLKTEVLAAH